MAKRAVNEFKPMYVKILIQIDRFTHEHGYSPTVRELCSLVGLSSTSTVHGHLRKMAEFGMISYEPARPRTLTIC